MTVLALETQTANGRAELTVGNRRQIMAGQNDTGTRSANGSGVAARPMVVLFLVHLKFCAGTMRAYGSYTLPSSFLHTQYV